MSLLDVWDSIRNKPGWLADCKEAGFSQEELIELEAQENEFLESYSGVDAEIEQFINFDKEESLTPGWKKIRNEKFPELDKRLKDHEIQRAREFPLHELLQIKKGARIPCPFHNGKDKNFLVTDFGYCFVCQKNCNSITWQMEIRGLNFPESVRSLN